MTFNKFKTDSFCVGGKHRSGTKKITVEKTVSKKTGKEIKLLVGKCVICYRKKSMILSDNTIQAEGLGDFFKNLGKVSSKTDKKKAKNAIKTLVDSLKLVLMLLPLQLLEILKQLY